MNIINKFSEIKDLDPTVHIMILRGECQANLEIEKGQIIDAFEEGYYDEKTSETYYKETYNKE